LKIRDLVEGKIQAKQVKQSLLQYRGRIVEDITDFIHFYINRIRFNYDNQNFKKDLNPNLSNVDKEHLYKEIAEKNELLEIIAEKINRITSKN
jgi:hypothetical protein